MVRILFGNMARFVYPQPELAAMRAKRKTAGNNRFILTDLNLQKEVCDKVCGGFRNSIFVCLCLCHFRMRGSNAMNTSPLD